MRISLNKKNIRRAILAHRKHLSKSYRKRASLQLRKKLQQCQLIRKAKTIALYLPHNGEIDLTPWAQYAWKYNKKLYLPVIKGLGHSEKMVFARYTPTTPLIKNKFNILEPKTNLIFPTKKINVILAPLVAFDRAGNRLGMGGGYYDRTFAYKVKRPHLQPYFVGTAYTWQGMIALATEPWDVKLNAVATNKKVTRFKS